MTNSRFSWSWSTFLTIDHVVNSRVSWSWSVPYPPPPPLSKFSNKLHYIGKSNCEVKIVSYSKTNEMKKSQSLGGGQLKKSQKKSKSISGILGWVLTFFDPKF